MSNRVFVIALIAVVSAATASAEDYVCKVRRNSGAAGQLVSGTIVNSAGKAIGTCLGTPAGWRFRTETPISKRDWLQFQTAAAESVTPRSLTSTDPGPSGPLGITVHVWAHGLPWTCHCSNSTNCHLEENWKCTLGHFLPESWF